MTEQRYGLQSAELWIAANFPHISHNDRGPLVRGIARIIYPHAQAAATADMADSLAEKFPDVAAALDQSSAERLAELERKGVQ
jgi:hypothetical protein